MTFISAFILGLLVSAHCLGMCGGLQTVFQQTQVIQSSRQAAVQIVMLNLGRLTTYTFAGVIFAWLGASLIIKLPVAEVSKIIRVLMAIMLIFIGLCLFGGKKRLAIWLEKAGAPLWQKMQTMIYPGSVRWHRHYLNGVAWGFLPCGLVYAVLITAIFSGSSVNGGLIMLGFGLGTIPSMVLTGGI